MLRSLASQPVFPKPLSILMLSWEYPPTVYGGLGHHVHGIAVALAKAGHRVSVLTQGTPEQSLDAVDLAAPVVEDGVHVHRLPAAPPAPPLDRSLAGFATALEWSMTRAGLRAEAPDLVHAHDWVTAQAGTTLAQAHDVPLVSTVHATEAGMWQGWITSDWSIDRHHVERWLTRRSTATVVCSQAMRTEVLTALQADPERVHVHPNGIDADQWVSSAARRAAARSRLGIGAQDPLVLMVGRAEHEKGAQVAIAAMGLLRKHSPTARLVLVGAGSQAGALAEQVAQARLSAQVTMAGKVTGEDLVDLLAAAQVALVPSLYEPFGIVALEAMAAGTPLVCSDAGGLPEVVRDGHTGLVVPADDPAALALAIQRLLASPALVERLSRAAADDVRLRFTWDAVVAGDGASAGLVSTYRRAVEAGPRVVGASAPSWRDPDVPGNVLSGRPPGSRSPG